jgi:hypothetical protein
LQSSLRIADDVPLITLYINGISQSQKNEEEEGTSNRKEEEVRQRQNQSTTISEAIMHLQEARTALQNNDTQGAMMELDIALNVLGNATQGGNVTTTTTTTTTALGDNATGRYGGGASGSAGGGDVQQ